MAEWLDTSFLTKTTREDFLPVMVNNLYDSMPLLKVMLAGDRVKPYVGTSLMWNVALKRHESMTLFKGYSTYGTQQINPLVPATLSNANYLATISISYEERKLNSGNQNESKLADMLTVQTKNMESTFREQMASHIYGSGVPVGGLNTIVGLAAIVATGNTYANIDRSVTANAGWRSNVNSTTYTDDNLADITNAGYLPKLMRRYQYLATHDGKSPDLTVTTKWLYGIYQDIYEGKLAPSSSMANLGFKGSQFDPTLSMIFDDYCTAGTLWLLTTDNFYFHIVEGANFEFYADMNGQVWQKSPNQLADSAVVTFMGQMRCEAPRNQALLSAKGTV